MFVHIMLCDRLVSRGGGISQTFRDGSLGSPNQDNMVYKDELVIDTVCNSYNTDVGSTGMPELFKQVLQHNYIIIHNVKMVRFFF